MTILIDRSNNNSGDDYAVAHKAGVTHLYAKASEGTGFTDNTYKARVAAARSAGLVVGGYHFAQSGDPVAEATHFLNVVGKPPAGHLRPCLDLESGESAAWAAAFVEHCHKVLGYWPALYGNTSTIPALRAANPSVRACPYWAANYGPNDGQQHPLPAGTGAAAHQYTSAAAYPGINGHTDASVFLDEKAMLIPGAAPAKKWPKPNHYGLDYTDVAGKPQHIKTRFPGLWQARHKKARWRGQVTTTPVFHPIKK